MTDLRAVPDPETEVTEGVPEPVTTYTVADQVHRNAAIVAEIVALHGLEQQVASNVLGLTLQNHLAKIQLGLTAPVEA